MLKYYAQIRLLISVILSSLWSLYTWNEVEDEVDGDLDLEAQRVFW